MDRKVLCVFGTRPEAIKMCPLVLELEKRPGIQCMVCATGQHREMLDGVLDVFGVEPDWNLEIMRPGQDLCDITYRVMHGVRCVLKFALPDLVLVHGDTTTAFAAALAAFYRKIPVGHVEAGLRTRDMFSPYPEEFNRQAVGLVAKYHFAPTDQAAMSLILEGKPRESIFVTGNTVIDAMRYTIRDDYQHPALKWAEGRKLILITAHRRENIGEPMRSMFRGIRRALAHRTDCAAIYPVHKNPDVQKIALEELGSARNFMLMDPLSVADFHNFEARCSFCVTDSGGIQEECVALGKPVLVMRNTTERPEGGSGLRLVGTDEEGVRQAIETLLDDPKAYESMHQDNPFGDGKASERIADAICQNI